MCKKVAFSRGTTRQSGDPIVLMERLTIGHTPDRGGKASTRICPRTDSGVSVCRSGCKAL
ncbi:hypothetical protein [Chamaesiphon polymorphus]|uniref:hypothetical protein n=1 Tax=Chamaesiphon polymorphus TaxID=2107691 RepID=UPI0011B20A85|nr:hypothetical protein [Chamaesiphon polymorphus]